MQLKVHTPDGEMVVEAKLMGERYVPVGCYFDSGERQKDLQELVQCSVLPIMKDFEHVLLQSIRVPGFRMEYNFYIVLNDLRTKSLVDGFRFLQTLLSQNDYGENYFLIELHCHAGSSKCSIDWEVQVLSTFWKEQWLDEDQEEEFPVWKISFVCMESLIGQAFSKWQAIEIRNFIIESTVDTLEKALKEKGISLSDLSDEPVEEKVDEVAEEQLEELYSQAVTYGYNQTASVLKKVIQNFDHFQITTQELPVLANMLKVATNPEGYEVNGYLQLVIKVFESGEDFRFQEITIDEFGLRLISGRIEVSPDFGPDTYSNSVFPPEDEYDAMETVVKVDEFFTEFISMLETTNREFEAADSGDGIDEK